LLRSLLAASQSTPTRDAGKEVVAIEQFPC